MALDTKTAEWVSRIGDDLAAKLTAVGLNLRTQLERIIHRGTDIEAWPRLFQNLRVSRETELAATFPLHVATKWIGNSAPITAKHYLKVTDAAFAAATRKTTPSLQNLVQSAFGTACQGWTSTGDGQAKSRQIQGTPSVDNCCSLVYT
jgi:hypothetical protein